MAVPDALIAAMRASPCLRLELADDERVRLLLEDYAFFGSDPELFCGGWMRWCSCAVASRCGTGRPQVRAGRIETVVRELLVKHYDPGYATSTGATSRSSGRRGAARRPTGAPPAWPGWRARSP